MANRVGVEFYVAGSSKFTKDIGGVSKSLLGVAKVGAGLMGGALSVRYIGRAMREFYSEAISNSKEAVTQIQAINSSWAETKKLFGEGMGDAMAPFYRDINGVIQSVNVAIRDATELQRLFDKLSDSEQAAVTSAYEQQTGGKFGYYAAPSADATAINRAMGPMGAFSMGARERFETPAQFVKPDDQIVAFNLMRQRLSGDEINGVSKAQESARGKVVSLNEALANQIRVQMELNTGNRDAAQILTMKATLEEAYAGDQEVRDRKLKYYISDLEKANKYRAKYAADNYIENLQQENQYLAKIQQGRKDEAELIKRVNEFKRQGIDLTQEEIDRIAELQKENQKLSEHYGDSFGGGAKSAIREMQDELYTLGDVGHDVTNDLHDSLTSELNDLIWESKTLDDVLKNVVKSVGSLATQMLLSNMVTSAMGGIGGLFSGGTKMHASGMVLDRPISWMDGNTRHVAGESGPEAIVPLERGPGGRLGLSGGSPNVKLEVHYHGEQKQVQTTTPRWRGDEWVVGVILNDMDHGGPLSERFGR